jgi:Acyl-CoA dehydrogenase, C-terminal domain
MDLGLTPDQELLDDTLGKLFAEYAGPRRSHELAGAVDGTLVAALESGGYLDVGYLAGPVEAVLFAERAAQYVACAPVIARALVGPLAGITGLPSLVGLIGSSTSLVRYAGQCQAYLCLDGETARLATSDDVEVEPVRSRTPYPMGRVSVRRSEPLGAGSGPALRRAWQVALAVEIGSMALAAVQFSARHVRDRHQFGRPIGSFQAVQHRLARSYSMAAATSALARRGAWHHDDEFVTASAATFACLTARETYDNTHQVTGAIGITTEYGLVEWTMRLLALHAELGGGRSHARHVVAARRSVSQVSQVSSITA